MDVCDRAQQLEEAARAAALTQRKADTAPASPSGVCFNCKEPLDDGDRFCDEDCRDDYVRLQARRENDRILEGLR
jgi:predicted nucleic acid-binding Zn ribbon protein